jgi:UDP:flavonoid glycosyltransferase YjiC (YdhE family)
MRVLFCSSPLLGYFLPLVPWAWALRAAGHEVRVATTGEGLEACDAPGCTHSMPRRAWMWIRCSEA